MFNNDAYIIVTAVLYITSLYYTNFLL